MKYFQDQDEHHARRALLEIPVAIGAFDTMRQISIGPGATGRLPEGDRSRDVSLVIALRSTLATIGRRSPR
jgi:hypothetical protein